MVRLTTTHSIVYDQARDKIYLDMRQTFSVWFFPLYHAHVRLVTVLDLVPSDGHDYHGPLDRILNYEGEEGTNGNSGRHHHDQRHNNGGGHQHHQQQHTGSRNGTNGHHHGSRTWKISKQEDLYQVNDFLRFLGGPGPLPLLWYLFQLSATAVCIFMSFFLSVSPWALQKEPARGGVEATIECVDDSVPDSPSSYRDVKNGDHDDSNNGDNKTGGGDSTTGGDPYAVGGGGSHNHDNHGASSGNGPANDTNGHHEHNGHNGHNHNNNHGHNGHRRGSSTSKASNSSAPKKSWKNGGKRKSKDAAAAAS